MEAMEWKPSYSVGVDELDADHKRLIDIINRVEQAGEDDAPLQWVLHELADYTQGHFRREMVRLEVSDYPDLENHKGEHDAFVEWLRVLETTLGATLTGTPVSQSGIAAAVANYLKLWLADHILVTDMGYREYLGE